MNGRWIVSCIALWWLPWSVTLSAPPDAPAEVVHGVSFADTRRVIQKVIDLPELREYFHVDVAPDRLPVVLVSNEYVPQALKLTAFGQPVRILSTEQIRKEGITSFLEVVDLERSRGGVRVVMHYPIEGLVVTATLEQRSEEWIVLDKSVVER